MENLDMRSQRLYSYVCCALVLLQLVSCDHRLEPLKGEISGISYNCNYIKTDVIMNSDYLCSSFVSPDYLKESTSIFGPGAFVNAPQLLVAKTLDPHLSFNTNFTRSLFWPRLVQYPIAQNDDISLFKNVSLSTHMPDESSAIGCLMDILLLLVEGQANDIIFSMRNEKTFKPLFNINPDSEVCFLPIIFNLASRTFRDMNGLKHGGSVYLDSNALEWRESLQFLRHSLESLCGIFHNINDAITSAKCLDPHVFIVHKYLSFSPEARKISLIDVASFLSLSPKLPVEKKQLWKEYLYDRGIKEALTTEYPLVFARNTPYDLLQYLTLHLTDSTPQREDSEGLSPKIGNLKGVLKKALDKEAPSDDQMPSDSNAFVLPSSVAVFKLPSQEYRLPGFKIIKGDSDIEAFTQFSSEFDTWRSDWDDDKIQESCIDLLHTERLYYVQNYVHNLYTKLPKEIELRNRGNKPQDLYKQLLRAQEDESNIDWIDQTKRMLVWLDVLTEVVYTTCDSDETKTEYLQKIARLRHAFHFYYYLHYREKINFLIATHDHSEFALRVIKDIVISDVHPFRIDIDSYRLLMTDLLHKEKNLRQELGIPENKEIVPGSDLTENEKYYLFIQQWMEKQKLIDDNMKELRKKVDTGRKTIPLDFESLLRLFNVMRERSPKVYTPLFLNINQLLPWPGKVLSPLLGKESDKQLLQLWKFVNESNYQQRLVTSKGIPKEGNETEEHIRYALNNVKFKDIPINEYFPNQLATLMYILDKYPSFCDRYLHWESKGVSAYGDFLYTTAIGALDDSLLGKLVSLKEDLPFAMLENIQLGHIEKRQLSDFLDSQLKSDWSYAKLERDIPHFCMFIEHTHSPKGWFVRSLRWIRERMTERSQSLMSNRVILSLYNIPSSYIMWRHIMHSAIADTIALRK